MTISQRKTVFISYSHTDIDWLKRLQVHLMPLERKGDIKLWSDEKIKPGSLWREEIKDAIKNAQVAVLLVSADFLASEFIDKDELPPLLYAAEKDGAVILPVIVSPCRFEKTANISKFQAVNSPKKTLLNMSKAEQEEVFVKVADAIVDALERVNEKIVPVTQPKTKEQPELPIYVSPMEHISGGWFDMGSSEGEDNEKPVHMVYVNDFYMGKYEVTREEFRKFIGETDYRTDAEKGGGAFVLNPDATGWVQKSDANWLNPYFKQSNNHPVVCVSWNDAVAYCNWRSEKEGLTPVYTIKENTVSADFSANGYRLPTEAEWEYAARCGEKCYKYSWGDGSPTGKRGGNIADESLKRAVSNWKWDIWKGYDDGYVYTSPVGSFNPNEFGLYDMTGNVWEWCWDWYGENYYNSGHKRNPQGHSSGNKRVVRGGAWNLEPILVRAAFRYYATPGLSINTVGFRLSRTF